MSTMRHFARKVKRMIMPDARAQLLNRMPKGAVCAEIGVWKGDFSRRIFDVTKPAALHLIDPWLFQDEYPDRMYGGKVAQGQKDMDAIMDGVKAIFAKAPQVKFHREKSDDALRSFQDEYFDWVYIDGNHYYEFVLLDLELSWLKVKPGGFVTGDDYDWGADKDYPVRRAVSDFMSDKGVSPAALSVIGNQFIIKKP